MKKSTIGVLGIGEVGQAIVKIFSENFNVLKKDLKFDELKNNKIEVLHVCIPFNKSFINEVKNLSWECKPDLIIIHSTVSPGTTQKVYKETKIPTVHSPVMGTHPNLKRDIKFFTKFIGPVNAKAAQLAKKHLGDVGIKSQVLKSPFETELGKLFDTTYYAWNIVFNKNVHLICKELGADFENVYTIFNQVYNQGYSQTKPNVLRPIIKYQKGQIGGHCLIPNAKILQNFKNNSLTRYIISENLKLKR